jgi:hypothetical protein
VRQPDLQQLGLFLRQLLQKIRDFGFTRWRKVLGLHLMSCLTQLGGSDPAFDMKDRACASVLDLIEALSTGQARSESPVR